MRLQKREEEELARRKGLAGRTVIQVIWLLISFALAYFVSGYLFSEDVITYAQIYEILTVSPSQVPQWVIQGGIMLIIVVAMQFVLFLGFAFADPEGRRRLGDPSLHSRRKDQFDKKY